jgi:hypothetical protein
MGEEVFAFLVPDRFAHPAIKKIAIKQPRNAKVPLLFTMEHVAV